MVVESVADKVPLLSEVVLVFGVVVALIDLNTAVKFLRAGSSQTLSYAFRPISCERMRLRAVRAVYWSTTNLTWERVMFVTGGNSPHETDL